MKRISAEEAFCKISSLYVKGKISITTRGEMGAWIMREKDSRGTVLFPCWNSLTRNPEHPAGCSIAEFFEQFPREWESSRAVSRHLFLFYNSLERPYDHEHRGSVPYEFAEFVLTSHLYKSLPEWRDLSCGALSEARLSSLDRK